MAPCTNVAGEPAQLFRSIYFREPGGILFEIATEIPGFAVDEPNRNSWSRLEAAEVSRIAAQGDRGRAIRSESCNSMTNEFVYRLVLAKRDGQAASSVAL